MVFSHGYLWSVSVTADLPKYSIIMWYGTLATIPTGWQICDGTNGTPDLRNYFVRGTPDGMAADNVSRGSNVHDHDGITGLKTGISIFLTGLNAIATTSHFHTIAEDDNIPEYKRMVFIMKT